MPNILALYYNHITIILPWYYDYVTLPLLINSLFKMNLSLKDFYNFTPTKVKFVVMRPSNTVNMKKNIYLMIQVFLLFPLAFYGQQFENPGFENWEDAGTVKDEPVDWNTIKTCDDPYIAMAAPVTFDISTDAHTGNYALKLFNVEVFGISATGAICNGRFHAEFDLSKTYSYTDSSDARWHTPFTGRPDSLTGWFKYFPQGNDAAQFKAILHVDSCKLPENGTLPNWVGMAVYKTPSGQTFDTWTRFSVPFEYYDSRTPQFILCVMNSGDSTTSVPDSYLLIDDLELKYSSSGTDDKLIKEEFLVQGNNHLTINIISEEEFLNRKFNLIDLAGQTVFSIELNDNRLTLPPQLKAGIYIALLDGKNHRYSQKIMVR